MTTRYRYPVPASPVPASPAPLRRCLVALALALAGLAGYMIGGVTL